MLVHGAAVAPHRLLGQRGGHVGQRAHHALVNHLARNLLLRSAKRRGDSRKVRFACAWPWPAAAPRLSAAAASGLRCTQHPIWPINNKRIGTSQAQQASKESWAQSWAHVVNGVLQLVPHRACQHVDLAGAAVGPVLAHALDDARQEAVGVADAAAAGAGGRAAGGGGL